MRTVICSVFLFLSITTSAQTSLQTAGVYYAYPAVEKSGTMPVAGYEPFYVSHYGRHGSRWLTSDDRYKFVMRYFDNKKELTPLGKDVRRRLKKVWRNARGNGGKLTPIGVAQHQGIARRMREALPEVFSPGATVTARSSKVGRCQKSRDAFVWQLLASTQLVWIDASATDSDAHLIAYDPPAVKQLERAYKPHPIDSHRFTAALFIHPERIPEATRLMTEMHTIASDMQDVGLSIDFFDLFTRNELLQIYRINNNRMQTMHGNVPANRGIAAESAVELWQDFVTRADRAILTNAHKADLRFGHDSNLMRLLSLLELSDRPLYELVPMAANLQLIFYKPTGERATAQNTLVRLLLNEHEVQLPFSFSGVLPTWQQMRQYYEKRITDLKHIHRLYGINTMVGTAQANTLTAGVFGKGSEEHGQTLPAVLAPNGQAFWTPQTQATEQKCLAPYYYRDSLFQGIRCSHWLVGGCTQDYGSFTIAVQSGQKRLESWQRATPFSHRQEISHPHYYKVYLPKERLTLELTGASHSALLRVTSDRDTTIHLIVESNSDHHKGWAKLNKDEGIIKAQNTVHRIYQGWGEEAGFSGHLVVLPLGVESPTGFLKNSDRRHGRPGQLSRIGGEGDPCDSIASMTFTVKAGEPMVFAIGSSLCDEEGAIKNLFAELIGKSFNEVCRSLENLWAERLSRIDVSDDDTSAVNQFYGALYRASFLPRELSDIDGRYPRFATGEIQSPQKGKARRRYTDFSMWDIYRAQLPLLYIIEPDMAADMAQSLVGMYEEGGWLPIFPCWNSYTAAMIGDHSVAALADAWAKGIRGFDVATAYKAARQNAFTLPQNFEDYKNGMGRRALKSYMKYGYIPLEDGVKEAFHRDEQTSRTLEYAFDDFCAAQLCRAVADSLPQAKKDYEILLKRSQNWRNVINPKTGYAQGRHKNGRFDSTQVFTQRQSYITEGAPCHYTWYVPHDVNGLIATLGGRERFTQRLDSLFLLNRYWHGNEPCHQVAYLYDYAGDLAKAQRWVRHTLLTEYNDTPGGLSGNDDAGQMSAWYVFSAMGFYPVCPGKSEYMLASPMFKQIKIRTATGTTFTISAPHANRTDYLMPNVSLNGKRLTEPRISHENITAGDTLYYNKE